jgi:pyruvate,water dikinase
MGAFRTEWDTEPNPTYDVWTTTNGGEVLPGVLRPFSATMYNHLDHTSLRSLMATYPTGKRVKLYKPPIGNFFGIVAGRLTLNVGFSVAAMSCIDPDIAAAMAGQFFQGSDDASRLIVRAPEPEVTAAVTVASEQRDAAEAQALTLQSDLYVERLGPQQHLDRGLPLAAAWARVQQLIPEVLDCLERHYVVSTAAGEMQVRLAGVIAAGGGDPSAVVGLCSGLGDVESSKPAIALHDLSMLAAKSAPVRRAFESGDDEAILTAMVTESGAGWVNVAEGYDEFIHRFGFRVQGEADPLNPDWGEQPTFVLSQIRSMMRIPTADSPRAQIKRSMQARTQLERHVRSSLPDELRAIFDATLAEAQRFTRMRELTKAVWVLSTRRMRPPLLAVADALAARGTLRAADDMEFCTYSEVGQMARGRQVDGLQASIKRRRAQWTKAHDYSLPDSFVGQVVPKRKPAVSTARMLTGMGVSIGEAIGVARVIMNTEAAFARDLQPGEILVAPFTDTPWTPLFIPAAAVVVETGGILSHAATVAREFGIPCVVLVADATRLIADGDTVRVNGATGDVEILRRAS